MPNMPDLRTVHIDRALSAFSIMYKNAAFIGERLMPLLKVNNQTDIYWVYPQKYAFTIRDDKRAPGTAAKTLYYDLTQATYSCQGHALNKSLADEVVKNADEQLNMEADSTYLVTEAILLNREKRYADLLTTTANYPAGHFVTPAVKWDVPATATPLTDILNGIAVVHSKIYKPPNILMVPFAAAVRMSQAQEVKDQIKYTGQDRFELLKLDQGIVLPKVLFGLEVIVAQAGYNTANTGQAFAGSYVWGDNCIIAYVDPQPKLQTLTFGVTFNWQERQTRKWYEQAIKSTYIETEEWTDEKIVASQCGYLMYDVLT